MSFKEKFENHPVVFGLSLVIAGFVAGYGAHDAISNSKTKPAPVLAQPKVNCTIEGTGDLSASHHQRLSVLQRELVRLEGKASDDSIISSYQNDYKESAGRVRNDIAMERQALKEALQVLSAKCS
ncbi:MULTISPECIES: hypothetical protein [unclassified Neptuniibacter]|uniref:hypothetical protein n=1 Tax=unclassified Neptuniibacter TaxID=2630693 RepID=UPI000C3D6AAE|nr:MULTISPECIES: hypothetical protein [unclassified Neptuniibacter]MAY43229.1 hypothetical protein [Oceanospirillaceae bacterium]|tara:strand:+ start:25896 stop:26270 length:375 start_codon:yes stop_codon:yes gene_type:complete